MTIDNNLHTLACEFFYIFSRIEYALKASGYNKGDGDAEPDWHKFALELEELIINPTSQELQESINFIFNAPPKKQVIKNGILQWKVAEPSTSPLHADKLFIYIRRIRNNLFHGGKFNGHWFEPERSEALLKSSLIILKACLESVEKVKKAYYG